LGAPGIDLLLLLTVAIWGSNFAIVKLAIAQIPLFGFNALRLLLASGLFLAAIAIVRRPTVPPVVGPEHQGGAFTQLEALSRRDWLTLVGLGLIGHFLYQLFFMGGLARTAVANASLIMSTTPVAVALINAVLGLERIDALHWIGAGLSGVGIYLVVGTGASISWDSFLGDLMMVGAVICWALYTVGSKPLLTRHSPLVVTGCSMALGTVVYLPLGLADLRRMPWSTITVGAWAGLVFSAVFALCVAYLIWYTAVQRIGSAKTSVYSNMVPVAGVATAVLWLGEPLRARTVVGAAAILAGVILTRLGGAWAGTPAEE
jgi:drug/metabolite transporter (DMT)-like permease